VGNFTSAQLGKIHPALTTSDRVADLYVRVEFDAREADVAHEGVYEAELPAEVTRFSDCRPGNLDQHDVPVLSPDREARAVDAPPLPVGPLDGREPLLDGDRARIHRELWQNLALERTVEPHLLGVEFVHGYRREAAGNAPRRVTQADGSGSCPDADTAAHRGTFLERASAVHWPRLSKYGSSGNSSPNSANDQPPGILMSSLADIRRGRKASFSQPGAFARAESLASPSKSRLICRSIGSIVRMAYLFVLRLGATDGGVVNG